MEFPAGKGAAPLPQQGGQATREEVPSRLRERRALLERVNFVFTVAAGRAERCADQEEEARISDRAELHQFVVERDAALVEAKPRALMT